MVSLLTAIAIAAVIFVYAAVKGRTGWHWSVMSLLLFGVLWLGTALALHFSDIRVSIAEADTQFAIFVGAVTAAVMIIIVAAVPARPRRRHPAPPPGFLERRPPV